MSNKKELPQIDWQQRIQLFASGNRNRTAAIASEGMTVVENKKLRDVEYDPVGKGNDLVITLVDGNETFRHTISAPAEIYITEESDGVVSSMEIVDQNGNSTFLRLLKK